MKNANRTKVISIKKLNIYLYFTFILILALITMFATNARAELQKIGVVGAANQTLSSKNESATSRTLELGQDIFFNDTLSTDKTGNAQLMFLDKSALTIGPNASVTIDKFVYNPADSTGELTMRGTKGAFRFIGGALSKKKEVQFKTPVGTIGIRGGIAIVEINPTSGATNATFLYGDAMTFKNLAGQMQQTTNAGFAIGVATPTSAPSVPAAVDSLALAAKIQNFTSSDGQHGGAKEVPKNIDMDKKAVTGEATTSDKKDSPGNSDGRDKIQGGDKQGNNKQGTNPAGNGNNNAADGGHPTPDGGYVDGNGKYYTPAEAAKRITDRPENGQGGTLTTSPNSDPANGSRNPGILTNDGGYIDAQGKPHTASELAAFRRTEAAGNSGGHSGPPTTVANTNYNNAGGAFTGAAPANTAGGYYPAPANGNYNNPPGGTYAAPMNGGYMAPMSGNSSGFSGYYGVPTTAPVMPPIVPINNNYNYSHTAAEIDAKAIAVRNAAYNAAINAGGTTPQATAAGVAAETTFRTNLANGGEFNAAATAGSVAGTTYINTYINNNAANNSTTFVNSLQSAQDTAAGVNTGSKYAIDDIAIPVGNVASQLIKQELFNNRSNLKNSMDTNKNTNCSTCSFVNWDVWAKVIPDNVSTTTTNLQAKLVPYVYGTPTQNIGVAVGGGTATYTGTVQGNTLNTSTGVFTAQQSQFKIDVDFSARTLSNLRNSGAPNGNGTNGMAFGAYNVTNSAAINIPTGAGVNAAFNNAPLTVTGGSGSATGSISGALFGNTAQNIGGNFKIDDAGANTKGAGLFIGARP